MKTASIIIFILYVIFLVLLYKSAIDSELQNNKNK